MIKEEDILIFIKKIVKTETDVRKRQTLITQYKDYLSLSQLCTEEIIDKLTTFIKEGLPLLSNFEALCDEEQLDSLLNIFETKTKETAKTKVKKRTKSISDRHYEQFGTYYSSGCGSSSSSGCGSSSSRSSGCGGSSSRSSYSSGCGSSSSSYSTGCGSSSSSYSYGCGGSSSTSSGC